MSAPSPEKYAISMTARLASVAATGWPTSPRRKVEDSERPTTNQAPAITASQPPNMAVARFPEISSKNPPAAAVTPGNTSSQARAVLHTQASPGVYERWKYGPMNGTNAPHAPKMKRSNPLTAPRLRGICRVPKPERESFIFRVLLKQWTPKCQARAECPRATT